MFSFWIATSKLGSWESNDNTGSRISSGSYLLLGEEQEEAFLVGDDVPFFFLRLLTPSEEVVEEALEQTDGGFFTRRGCSFILRVVQGDEQRSRRPERKTREWRQAGRSESETTNNVGTSRHPLKGTRWGNLTSRFSIRVIEKSINFNFNFIFNFNFYFILF